MNISAVTLRPQLSSHTRDYFLPQSDFAYSNFACYKSILQTPASFGGNLCVPGAVWLSLTSAMSKSVRRLGQDTSVRGAELDSPWSHRLPTQPSSQTHCHAFSHVPCRQPGKGTHWSQFSPCHPGLHLNEGKREQSWTINIPPTELCSPAHVPIMSACFVS